MTYGIMIFNLSYFTWKFNYFCCFLVFFFLNNIISIDLHASITLYELLSEYLMLRHHHQITIWQFWIIRVFLEVVMVFNLYQMEKFISVISLKFNVMSVWHFFLDKLFKMKLNTSQKTKKSRERHSALWVLNIIISFLLFCIK